MNITNNSNVMLTPPHSLPYTSPPRPSLVFRVGVVGHRPNRLENADAHQLKHVLNIILGIIKDHVLGFSKFHTDLYDPLPPTLRAISPLAEGTDRLFAQQALNLGFELCCVMPFSQAEYEKDFGPENVLEPDSLSRFRGLLARAEEESQLTCFELCGSREKPGMAYGEAGRVVLNQSDILIVVWDGVVRGKTGGTEQTLNEARNTGVPMVIVDACAPHAWQIVDAGDPLPDIIGDRKKSGDASPHKSKLQQMVHRLLDLPDSGMSHDMQNSDEKAETRATVQQYLMDFYQECRPKYKFAVLWKAFRDILGDGKPPDLRFSNDSFEEAVAGDWPGDQSGPLAQLVDRLRPFYAWPDQLSVIYADRYRSAFILTFLLAAVAVGMALLPMGLSLTMHSWGETLLIASEFAIIVLILCLVLWGRRHRWHERWIDYRLCAELVRHLRLVAPLGGGRPFPQIPAHWSTYGHPGASWMAWYVCAVERVIGLPRVVMDKKHITRSISDLHKLLTDQIQFHHINAIRCRRIEHRLHVIAVAFLGLTLIACGLHLLPGIVHKIHMPHGLPSFLTFCCGFFPAFGAALAGISNQGEFQRIAKRSASMEKEIKRLSDQIDTLKSRVESGSDLPDPLLYSQALRLAKDAAHLMVYEVLDWRVVFMDRPLHPPA